MGVVITVNVSGRGMARRLKEEIGEYRTPDATFSILDERTRMRLSIAGEDVRPATSGMMAMYYAKPFRGDLPPQTIHKRRLIVEATRYL
jgi:hypothetical protein